MGTVRVSRAVKPHPLGKQSLHAPGHPSSQGGKAPLMSSHSFKDALMSSKDGVQKVEDSPDKTDEFMNKKIIKFSNVERSTREWMARSVVCKRRVSSDVWIIQRQIQDFGANIRVHPIGETFCFVSFSDEETMCSYLLTRLLESWFSEVKAWEDSELADGSIRWVCLRGVPIPL